MLHVRWGTNISQWALGHICRRLSHDGLKLYEATSEFAQEACFLSFCSVYYDIYIYIYAVLRWVIKGTHGLKRVTSFKVDPGTDDERSCVASNGSLESSRARRRPGLGAGKLIEICAFLTDTTLPP